MAKRKHHRKHRRVQRAAGKGKICYMPCRTRKGRFTHC